MRTIWQSLAWKEWNEHKWKLVSILGVIWSLLVIVFLLSGGERHTLAESLYVAELVGGIPMAVFIGLSAAAGERSRGTLSFLQALPVPLWRVALHKIGFSLLTVTLPVVVTALGAGALYVILYRIGLGPLVVAPMITAEGALTSGSHWIIESARIAILTAVSLVIWAAVLGNNRKDEVSAGATASVVAAVWWGALTIGWLYFLKATTDPDSARLRAVGVASAPLGFFIVPNIAGADQGCLVLAYAAAIVVHLSLAARYMIRFGRADDFGNRSARGGTNKLERVELLAGPHRFRLTAIAWKQFRESSPVALAGLAAIAAISACFCFGSWYVDKKLLDGVGEIYSQTAIIFGFFIALVTGIGVALQDVGSPLNTFWRSRPIQPDLWFWTKFISALLLVLAAVYVPIGLLLASGESSINQVMEHPDAPMMVATIVASQVAIFAAAVMMTCLVRQAVYAAILSIAVVYLGIMTYHIIWMTASSLGLTGHKQYEWWEVTKDQGLAGLCVTFVVCAIIAWLAMRNDWGHTSRY